MRTYFNNLIELYEQKTLNQKGYSLKTKPILVDSLYCDVQPSNREQVYNIYGYYIDCEFVVYFDNEDISFYEVSENTLVKFNNKFYSITKLIKWSKHTELYIKYYDAGTDYGNI